MKTSIDRSVNKSQPTAKQRASSLLEWLRRFLPTALPDSAEEAILDTSGDIHALLWHRSELENILQKNPSALTTAQRRNLIELDTQMRQSALLIVGSEKGHLRRYREGRYDRSHWWWYLDDILQEEAIAKSQKTIRSTYSFPAESERLQMVADRREGYGKKQKTSRRTKK
jgi:hypothetical protein